jgi:hypothetical protein
MDFWFGRWWLCIWASKYKEINIGVGDDLGEGDFGAFFIRNRRWGPFWVSTSRPTLAFLNNTYLKRKQS